MAQLIFNELLSSGLFKYNNNGLSKSLKVPAQQYTVLEYNCCLSRVSEKSHDKEKFRSARKNSAQGAIKRRWHETSF
jgi:hypothetical protein